MRAAPQLLFLLLLTIFIGCDKNADTQNDLQTRRLDSIQDWIKSSKKPTHDSISRSSLLHKAYWEITQLTNDSLANRALLKVAFEAYKLNDTNLFRKANNKTLKLSQRFKDTFGLADYHWNYGAFYANKEVLDSSYYHYFQANKLYKYTQNEFYSAKMLYNMAFVLSRLKDYTSSEAKLFQAITTYTTLNKHKELYKCYNLLGSIYKNIGEFDNALLYHNKSMDVLKHLDNDHTYYTASLSDIGLVYKEQRDYEKAITYFKNALNTDDLLSKNSDLYDLILDNLSHTRLLNKDTLHVKKNMLTSLESRLKRDDFSGIVINKLHLADYYLYAEDTVKALQLTKEAKQLASKINNKRDVLASLLLLSKISGDSSNAYLNTYIKVSDELQTRERQTREQFARIRFETDAYIQENEKLSLERTIVIIISIGLIAILSLLYFLRLQKTRNKQLLLEKEQQRANAEIYKLMLDQQSKMEEGRMSERFRISEELHDGVLSKIYGTRMGLGLLDIAGQEDIISNHKRYLNDLQEVEREIRIISHELKNDILASKSDYIKIIESLLESQSILHGYDYFITHDPTIGWNSLHEETKINIYRILQECLQNINKHSKASKVNLFFEMEHSSLKVTIKDNGIGILDVISDKGIGIKNIKRRVQNLHGQFELHSKINHGTTMVVYIPKK